MKTEDLLSKIKYCSCGTKATFKVRVMGDDVFMCTECAMKRPQNKKVLL